MNRSYTVRQTDGGDHITAHANAVSNNVGTMAKQVAVVRACVVKRR